MVFGKSNLSILVGRLWAMLLVASMLSSAATMQQPSTNRDPPCTGSFDWLGPVMNASDCVAAIGKLWDTDVAQYGHRDLEFIGKAGIRRTRLRPVQTPRRYTAGKARPEGSCERGVDHADWMLFAGTCTLVIAMLDLFPLMDLPEPPKPPFRPSDVSSFRDTYEAATSVHLNCVRWLRQAGYQQEGKRSGFVLAFTSFSQCAPNPNPYYCRGGV